MSKYMCMKVEQVAALLYSKKLSQEEYYAFEELPPFFAMNEATAQGLQFGWLMQKYKKQLDELTIEQLKKYPNYPDYEVIEKLPPGAKIALQQRIAMAEMKAMDMDDSQVVHGGVDGTLTAVAMLLQC